MTDHSWKRLHDGDTRRSEWPMPDRQVRLCPETADGVGQVTDAY